jgi:hypothetical protein
VVEESNRLVPIEIKAGETFSPRFFDAISYWKDDVVKKPDMQGVVIYGGNQEQSRSQGEVVSWKNVGELLKKL